MVMNLNITQISLHDEAYNLKKGAHHYKGYVTNRYYTDMYLDIYSVSKKNKETEIQY